MKSSNNIPYIESELSSSFMDYLLRNKQNKTVLWTAAIVMVIQFCVFKYFYPYASYIHDDSFEYLGSAFHNFSIGIHFVGYPMFLRAFSILSTSDTALVAFQYFFLQTSALFLLFTVFFLYNPGKVVQLMLFCFMVFNPLFLYLGNLIATDALFAALSLIWFALLLWIIHRPGTRLMIWHTVIIFIAFTVRFNALNYLFIATLAFILSKQSWLRKVVGLAAAIFAIGLFVLHTGNLYKRLTGNWQFSPFAGWQLANNAMYTYRYVDSADRKPVPIRFRKLDNMIRAYFDRTRDTNKFPDEKLMASTMYMWTFSTPLYQYRDSVVYKNDTTTTEFKRWSSMGPLYKDYGRYIIEHYPDYFARYFLWPNTKKYYAPPVEFLSSFNDDKDSVEPIAQVWFKYKSRVVKTRAVSKEVHMLDFYPILSGVVNVVMFFGLLSFALLDGLRHKNRFRRGIIIGGTAWLSNAAFTIFASSAALRFQAFPILLSTIFMGLLIDWLAQMASVKQTEKTPSTGDLVTADGMI